MVLALFRATLYERQFVTWLVEGRGLFGGAGFLILMLILMLILAILGGA